MTSVSMMKALVGKLNDPPFCSNLSLLEFDELSGPNLLALLNKVLLQIDPSSAGVDVRSEDVDIRYRRMLEFVHVLGYQADMKEEYGSRFFSGNKEVIHPILQWLLNDIELHKERAYLAKYLVGIQLPPEFSERESRLSTLHKDHATLQERFETVHAMWRNAQHDYTEVNSIKQEIQKLDKERLLLQTKIQKLREKPEVQTHLKHLLEATEDLWTAHEEEEVIATRSHQQAEQFSYLCEQHELMKQQLHATQGLWKSPDGNTEEFLQLLTRSEERSEQVINLLKTELDVKRRTLAEVEEILATPPPAAAEFTAIEQAIIASQTRLSDMPSQQKKMEELLSLRKRKELEEGNVKEATTQQQAIALKLAVMESEFRCLRGYPFMNKQEFKEYSEMLREKTNLYKQLKERTAQLTTQCEEDEKAVSILKVETEALKNQIAELIRTRGVSDYRERLDKFEQMKKKLEKSTGAIEELRSQLQRLLGETEKMKKDKEKALEPLKRMYEQARKEESRVKGEHGEKKEKYEAALRKLEEPIEETCASVKALRAKLNSLRDSLELKRTELETTTELLERYKREKRRSPHADENKRHSLLLADELNAAIEKTEEEETGLRTHYEQLVEQQDFRREQFEAFVNLEGLLKAKLEAAA